MSAVGGTMLIFLLFFNVYAVGVTFLTFALALFPIGDVAYNVIYHPQSSPSGPQGDGPRLHILQASGGAAPSIWNALRSSSAKRRVLHFRFMCLTLKKLSQHHSTKEVKPSLTPRGPRSPTVNPQAWPSLGTQHSLFSLIWCECFSDIFLPQSVNSMKRKPMPVCVHLCPFVLLFKANRHSEIESNPRMTPAAKAAGVP